MKGKKRNRRSDRPVLMMRAMAKGIPEAGGEYLDQASFCDEEDDEDGERESAPSVQHATAEVLYTNLSTKKVIKST